MELLAAADNDPARLRDFASRHQIPNVHGDWKELVSRDDVAVVHVATPNYLHGEMAIASARASKHVVCEKPLSLSLEEADELLETCAESGVKLCYAERFCFAPKLVWAKELADSGRIGDVHSVKYRKSQSPMSPTAWDRMLAGGGVLVDVAVHGIEYARWVMGKKPVETVYAQLGSRLRGNGSGVEDESLVIMEFSGGQTAFVESSWVLSGPAESRAEILGRGGVVYADVVGGGARYFTTEAHELRQAGDEWLFGGYRSVLEQGYPQEIAHYMECIRDDVEPRESGEDGRAVLEIVMAAYHSAGTGRKVSLPFRPEGIERPVDLWQRNRTS